MMKQNSEIKQDLPKLKFDLDSVSYWSGEKESYAHPYMVIPPTFGYEYSLVLLNTDLPVRAVSHITSYDSFAPDQ
jgi:hypothetical protein